MWKMKGPLEKGKRVMNRDSIPLLLLFLRFRNVGGQVRGRGDGQRHYFVGKAQELRA